MVGSDFADLCNFNPPACAHDLYDTNKEDTLDKEERAKISKEDQEKMDKAGLSHKKGAKKDDTNETK